MYVRRRRTSLYFKGSSIFVVSRGKRFSSASQATGVPSIAQVIAV